MFRRKKDDFTSPSVQTPFYISGKNHSFPCTYSGYDFAICCKYLSSMKCLFAVQVWQTYKRMKFLASCLNLTPNCLFQFFLFNVSAYLQSPINFNAVCLHSLWLGPFFWRSQLATELPLETCISRAPGAVNPWGGQVPRCPEGSTGLCGPLQAGEPWRNARYAFKYFSIACDICFLHQSNLDSAATCTCTETLTQAKPGQQQLIYLMSLTNGNQLPSVMWNNWLGNYAWQFVTWRSWNDIKIVLNPEK